MKRYLEYILTFFVLLALSACSEDNAQTIGGTDPEADGRELIAFVGDDSGMTRASLPNVGFSAPTRVVMRLKAHDVASMSERYSESFATATFQIAGTDSHTPLVGNHSDLEYQAGQERYWDEAFGRNTRLTVYAFAIPGQTEAELPDWSSAGWSMVNATTNRNWYTGTEYVNVSWHVSTAQTAATQQAENLVYSNNISDGGEHGRYTHDYDDGNPQTLKDNVVLGEGCMRWLPKTKEAGQTTGKYDQGHLIFGYTLAWIEINLQEKTGFNNTVTTDFGWTRNGAGATQNMTLKGFNTEGVFNVGNGEWTGQTANDITQLEETSVTHADGGKTTRKLYAYVVPGTTLYGNDNNVVEFEIDDVKYYVKGSQIATAIRNYYNAVDGPGKDDDQAAAYREFTAIEAGKHYVINLNVSKKKVEQVTAAIAQWEDVHSTDAEAKNTYPTFTLEDRGERLTSGNGSEFNIYRAAYRHGSMILDNTVKDYTWGTGYNADGKATKAWNSTSHDWGTTSWFWPDSYTAYHFRAAGIDGGDATTDPVVTTAANDFFEIHSGTITGSSYKDYTWGAPFKELDSPDPAANTAKLTYSLTTGFDDTDGEKHQISEAIGATESPIHMLLFHMTSQITVNVTTTADASRVILQTNDGADDNDKTKVELLNFLPDGTVQMGDGLVTPTGTRVDEATLSYGSYTAQDGATPAKYSGYRFGVVPQALAWTDPTAGQIGLRITTPDGNQYYVRDLSACTAAVTTNNMSNPYAETAEGSGRYIIDRWYPNWRYTYTVTLKKTGVAGITAAVVPWETVEGDLGTIGLEN